MLPQPLIFSLYLCMFLWYGKYVQFALGCTALCNPIYYNNAGIKKRKKKKGGDSKFTSLGLIRFG